MKRTAAPLLGVVLACCACADGQLGQSSLAIPCADGDEGCDDDRIKAPIAQGGRLAVTVRQDLAGAFAVPLSLVAVDERVLQVGADGAIEGVAPGLSAVLVTTDGGVVMDVIHLTVLKPTRLTLHRGGGADVDERALPPTIQLFAGEELTLSARAFHEAQEIGGDLVETWSASNPDFQLANQGFAHERRLRAPASGTTDVTVTLPSGLTTTLRLEVLP